jgi:hypothetical protein
LIARLAPLWRYAVFFVCLFGVSAFAVAVRLDVQQMRKDFDRNGYQQREASVLNDRLHLEMDARRRAAAMEVVAGRLALGSQAGVVLVEGSQP